MYLGGNYPKFFPAGLFFPELQIELLSKCPYFKKPPAFTLRLHLSETVIYKTQNVSHKTLILKALC